MNKIILTGATSMLGVALINECIKNETMVFAIVRPSSINLDRIQKSSYVKIIECELSNLDKLKEHIEVDVYEAFYHFGWEATSKETRDDPILQNANIQYTLEAVKIAKKLGCKSFIGAGSQAEYGRVSNTISPNTAVNPDIAYGIAKYAAGKLSRILCVSLGMKHIWTRIFSVYGPYDNDYTMIMQCINKLLKGQKPSLTKCEQMWDYLYCGDAAKAFYLLGERGKDQEIYCIGSGKPKQLSEYVTIIKDSIDSNIDIGIGELPYAPNQVMHLCADISNLYVDTGFRAETLFEDGIKKTIEWINESIKKYID